MGNPIAGWQDAYYMIATTSITESPDFSGVSEPGAYGAGKPQCFLRNHPSFDINKGIIAARKATGRAYIMKGNTTRIERTPGTVAPTTSYEMDLDYDSCFIPLFTFFQDTDADVTSGAVMTFAPYASSTVSVYAALLRTTETGYSHKIVGAIPNSITIKGEESDSVQMTVEWTGADMSTAVSSTVATWTSGATQSFKLFQDLTFQYETTGDAMVTADLVGFEVTMTNNVVAKHYDHASMQRHILGDLDVSGTFRVPWSSSNGGKNEFLTRLLDGNDLRVHIFWGSIAGTTVGDFAIKLNIEVDTATLSGGEDEAINEVAFTGIYDSVYNPIEIVTKSNVSRLTGY